MAEKKWESLVKQELYERLFTPRLNRITTLLKGRKPKKITAKQKRTLKQNLYPLVIQALKKSYEEELKAKYLRYFRLPEIRTSKKRILIMDKLNRYDQKMRKFIYTLWKDRRTCLYVGQTMRGVGEITSKEDALIRESKMLKIYEINRTCYLDRYEGIALHIFAPKGKERPKYNDVHTPNAKKKCPFCRTRNRIYREVENAFVIVKKK